MQTHLILGRALAEIAGTLFPVTKSKKSVHAAMSHVQVVTTESGGLRFVATDGHRLIVQDVDPVTNVSFPRWQEVIPDSKNEIGHIILDPAAAERLAKILRTSAAKPTEAATMRIKRDVGMIRVDHKLGHTELTAAGMWRDVAAFDDAVIAFQHNYLADALQDATALNRQTYPVVIRFYGTAKDWTRRAVLIESDGSDSRTFTVLMPILHF